MMVSIDTTERPREGPRGLLTSRRGARPHRQSQRRGNVLVLTTLLMVGLFGLLAFSVDTGWILKYRTELQRTADACALAAADWLPDESEATSVAHSVAEENGWSSGVRIGDGDVLHGSDLDPMDVDFGFWDRDTATFTTPSPSGKRVNAVRVTLRRTTASRNPIGLFFGRVVGTSRADVSASAIAWYDRGLCGPFVGIDWLDVGGGASTDSYDSEGGNVSYSSSTARDRGSICSDGPVDVSGNSIVRGDALAGRNQPLPDISGTATVTRHIGNRITPLDLPPVDAEPARLDNDNADAPLVWQGQQWRPAIGNNGDFSLNAGEVYDLPGGTYYLRNVTLNGGATLNISALTKIYITGTFRREGGCYVNNNTRCAQNLQINVAGDTVNITSDNPFYGVIYAPGARFTLNASSDLFGAVVGRTLSVSGSGIGHYDESMNLEYVEVPRRRMLVD